MKTDARVLAAQIAERIARLANAPIAMADSQDQEIVARHRAFLAKGIGPARTREAVVRIVDGRAQIESPGRPNENAVLRITPNSIVTSCGRSRMALFTHGDPKLTNELQRFERLMRRRAARSDRVDDANSTDAASLLFDTVNYAFDAMTVKTLGTQDATDEQAVSNMMQALRECSTMIEIARPDRLLCVVADPVARTITAELFEALECRIVSKEMPIPERLTRLLPGTPVLSASASELTVLAMNGKHPKGVPNLSFHLRPSMNRVLHRQDPMTTALIVRRYGDDGSCLAAAIDAALASHDAGGSRT